ncbi:pseudouridine synthase [Nonomuraea phyllanthi]|uniref:Pseudouridine synthase n=1 Tax=Nonomuraea phyllanthi TaxID=2219224 RepID=A0A5C4VTS7_9ACTN|nr:pseudouridine synthase [Nonomuraea phyllanthi]
MNRRSTPSGDGRGRGRTGGSGQSRGGRPAFRSDSGSGFRSNDSRGGSRRDDSRGGGRRDDFRGGSRDSLRADRSGSRAGYGAGGRDSRPGRDDRRSRDDRDQYGRGDRYGRDERGGGGGYGAGRRDERGGYGAGRREDRGGYATGGRDDRRSRSGDERGGGYGAGRRDERGGGYGSGRRDERGGYGAGRREDRGGHGAGRRDERGGGYGAGGRDERGGGYGSGRRDERGGYGAGRREERGGYGAGRRDQDGGGYGAGRRDQYGDDRGGFRADRTGHREGAPATRARYGRRDDAPRQDRAPRGNWRDERAPRGSRRDERTERDAPRRTRRDDVQTIGSGSPQRDRVKAARQPLRDRDFYPDDYTDERDTTEVPDGVRLQKVLAQAGVASRRACEELIGEGRVTVNGQVVRRFGAKVDPATQVIHVDGKRIPTAPDLVYYALNKPIGVVSTMSDPQGRPCLADYVEELAPRLFHVGRLDTETEGLLLLTNDGELANRLTHPSYGVQKKYWAKVPGPIPRDLGRRLKQGVELEDGLARADSFSIVQEHGQQALVEIVLHEGRKHVVRRMLEESGHRVIDLARIEFGPVKLGRTKPGTFRALTLQEVGELYAAVKL